MTTMTQAFALQKPRTSLLRTVKIMMATAQTRRQLKQLDVHLLDDIGLSYSDAHIESRRLAWDLR